jgi:hypothetical protein
MVNEDILGGIELGVAKGESIESIMMGFFNAGYHREDIEWAAKAFQLNQFKGVLVDKVEKPKDNSWETLKAISENKVEVNSLEKPGTFYGGKLPPSYVADIKKNSEGGIFQKLKGFFSSLFSSKKPTVKTPEVANPYYAVPGSSSAVGPEVKQNVSRYGQATEFKERIILIVLVSSLILLLAILAGVFLFKEQIANFINSLFSG